jgi:outer membrane lipase/esterase
MRMNLRTWVLAAALGVASAATHALPTSLFVFGDSLSDSGNNSIVFDTLGLLNPSALPTPVPPDLRTPVPVPNPFTGGTLVPTYPYDTSQFTPAVPFDRYTNGFIWAEHFAGALGLTALPSLVPNLGTDFAFAGARTGPANSSFPFSLTDQVGMFAAGLKGNPAPPTALYVVAGGGNNARDTIQQIIGILTSPLPPAQKQQLVMGLIDASAATYAGDIAGILTVLQALGATNITVWNTPDAGVAPAILTLAPLLDPLFQALLGETFAETATDVAEEMNEALADALGKFPSVRLFDLFGLVDSVVADPARFGLLNATAPCAALPLCDPSRFLFWDGIHPTSAGHLIIGNAMIAFVPEPTSAALVLVAVIALTGVSRRSRSSTSRRT